MPQIAHAAIDSGANESCFCDPAQEGEKLAGLNTRRAKPGTKLVAKGMELEIAAE